MLCQTNAQKRLLLITCTSRKPKKHELKYTSHDIELLALVDAVDKWRHYLY